NLTRVWGECRGYIAGLWYLPTWATHHRSEVAAPRDRRQPDLAVLLALAVHPGISSATGRFFSRYLICLTWAESSTSPAERWSRGHSVLRRRFPQATSSSERATSGVRKGVRF